MVVQNTIAALDFAPTNCAIQYSMKRTSLTVPTNSIVSEMFGVKTPKMTQKKSHADTRRLKPMDVTMYITCSVMEDCLPPPSVSVQKAERRLFRRM